MSCTAVGTERLTCLWGPKALSTDSMSLIPKPLTSFFALQQLGYSTEDLNVELSASKKQHVLDLYCSKGRNYSYTLYVLCFRMAYRNARFSELGRVLTKVALEHSPMVLCSPGADGGNHCWRCLLERLTLTSTWLPDDAIYAPLGRKTPIWRSGWGGMLSALDGSLASVSWEDPDVALVQEIQFDNSGYSLDALKRHPVQTTPGASEYHLSDAAALRTPCNVPNIDVVSWSGLSELHGSMNCDDETDQQAYFV